MNENISVDVQNKTVIEFPKYIEVSDEIYIN